MKLKGFTLLEAMISILLSTLLVGFTFTIYKNFNQYYLIYNAQTNRLNSLLQFKQQFNKDWNKALTITSNSDKTIILATENQKITYYFNDSSITRFSDIEQNYKLIPKSIELEKQKKNKDKITFFLLKIEKNQQEFIFLHHKQYGVVDFVRNKTHQF